jgi:hypothetical protein
MDATCNRLHLRNTIDHVALCCCNDRHCHRHTRHRSRPGMDAWTTTLSHQFLPRQRSALPQQPHSHPKGTRAAGKLPTTILAGHQCATRGDAWPLYTAQHAPTGVRAQSVCVDPCIDLKGTTGYTRYSIAAAPPPAARSPHTPTDAVPCTCPRHTHDTSSVQAAA